jgi:hypothetical protein
MRSVYGEYHEPKVLLWTYGIYTAPQHHSIHGRANMTAATITQAQDKGLRHQLSALAASVGAFATELFAAHGGWLAPATKAGFLRAKLESRARLLALASTAETHSPSLSNELRNFASRG